MGQVSWSSKSGQVWLRYVMRSQSMSARVAIIQSSDWSWRIHLQFGSFTWLMSWSWLLMWGLCSSPCWLPTGQFECPLPRWSAFPEWAVHRAFYDLASVASDVFCPWFSVKFSRSVVSNSLRAQDSVWKEYKRVWKPEIEHAHRVCSAAAHSLWLSGL